MYVFHFWFRYYHKYYKNQKPEKHNVCQSRFVILFEQCLCLLNEVDSQINIYIFASFVILLED